ncbi:MAG: hypothetical protein ABIO39_00025 [Caulobacteraceae bacterium]
MSRSTWSLSGLALALACVCAGTAKAATAHPDFTGVYGNYVDPREPRAVRGAPLPELPFTPSAKAKVDEYQSLVSAKVETPGAFCLGAGMPAAVLGSGGYPMEIIQRPEQITAIYELHTEVRRFYFGPRIMPAADRVEDRDGTSSARWDGDTLVVETENLKEQVDQRYAHSANARIVERYRFDKGDKGQKILVAELTLTDPDFYTRPVTVTKKWAPVANGHLMPYDCNEEAWINHLQDLRKAKAGKG